MSIPTSPTSSANSIVNNVLKNQQYTIRFGCPACDQLFSTKHYCDNHVQSCSKVTNSEDLLGVSETDANRTNSIQINVRNLKIHNKNNASNSTEHQSTCSELSCSNKIKKEHHTNLKQETNNTAIASDPKYEATSEMLSQNEMLVTLPYDQVTDSADMSSDSTKIVPINYEEGNAGPQYISIEYNDDQSSSENVTVSIDNNTVIVNNFEQMNSIDVENNVKTLTILNPVSVNEHLYLEANRLTEITQQEIERDTNFEFERVVEYENSEQDGRSESLSIEIENETPNVGIYKINESQKEVQKFISAHAPKTQKRKAHHQDNQKIPFKEVRYKRIMAEDTPTEPEPPNEFSVYEFYDEEEERIKKQKLEKKQREKALRERTCRYCNKIFDDPIDVLRHKRESHRFSKIILTEEQLKPYENHPDKTKCPVCLKPINTKGHKSMFMKHLITHSEVHSFECKICEMQFRRKDHYENHTSRHIVGPKGP